MENMISAESLEKLYGKGAEDQLARYEELISLFNDFFGKQEKLRFYSAPGRSEICGNHTDHQRGKALAASVNLDTIAAVHPTGSMRVRVMSRGHLLIDIDLLDLQMREEEKGNSPSLVRGVAAGFVARGMKVGGFDAYTLSNVYSGSGLSSSAAFEILIGTIFNDLFNDDKADPVTLARIGQEAENDYFGKPSGLLDQLACSVGGLISIDFENIREPLVEKLEIDFNSFEYSLCIVKTDGSHADLTDDYAMVPAEMRSVAGYFGKEVLREVDEHEFYKNLPEIRSLFGDRPVLRAAHFFNENRRVEEEKKALASGYFECFKALVIESGRSSFEYLQNVFSSKRPEEEALATALMLSERLLKGKGAWRVHGGGFAGTIQAFVPQAMAPLYKAEMEKIPGFTCSALSIRPCGGIRVI